MGKTTTTSGVDEKHDALIRDALEFVGERSWAIPTEQFFPELVKYLAETLGVAYATCSRVSRDDPDQAVFLGRYHKGEIVPNKEYSLKHAPCEDVMKGKLCVFPEGIQEAYPLDEAFITMNAESYVAAQLLATDGKTPIGLINVIDTKPLQDAEMVQRVLELVAKRAGAELERLLEQERTAEAERRLADFLQISSDWYWETGPDLRWRYFSEQFEGVTGVPPGNLLGKTRREVGAPGSDPKAYAQLLDDMDNRRPFRDFEHTRLKADGTLVHLAISANPAYDKNGNFLGYRGAGRDVSRFHAIESKFRDSMVEAQRANQAKTRFLASMSHELRTPLNAIIGFSELLKSLRDEPLSERQREYLGYVETSGNHLLSLVEHILDVAKIESEQVTLNIKDTEFCPIVDECMEMVRQMPECQNIEIINACPPDCHPVVRCDPTRTRQSILNILTNAVKYNRPGGSITIRPGEAEEGMFAFEASDTGIGISEKDQEKIFDLFHRAVDNHLTASEGTGLGLGISKLLIEQMGGEITCSSVLGEGSTFRVTLPLATST